MLADRLPYEDDTPTKVVFKHIHDPVPDPRESAPHRGIPDDLAEICLKALRKKAAERFQTADEMYEALKRVEERLDNERAGNLITCAHCGTRNPSTQKFCGGCGARLVDRLSLPPSLKSGPPSERRSLVPQVTTVLVGREQELERIVQMRDRSSGEAMWIRLLGEAGVGKSRLMTEAATRLVADGDVVAVAGPHPSGAPVAYWAIRQLLMELLEVDEKRLEEVATSSAIGDPVARAGMAEVLDPKGLGSFDLGSKAEAVAVALTAAVQVAAGRSESGRVALFVDDLWRCDSLSGQVLNRLVERMPEGPLFLVTASHPHRPDTASDDAVKMFIRGLEAREAAALLHGSEPEPAEVDNNKQTAPEGRLLLPLYVEQLAVLGHESIEGDDGAPRRLADAVLARVERLDIVSRRLLQVIVTIGDSAPHDWIEELARGDDLDALHGLVAEGLVTKEGDTVRMAHPFVRELVEASIPAEYRKELHAAALQLTASRGAPLEVRAEHAWRAGEPMSALLLLERMGDQALQRGDALAAVLAFRRGLELARRELHMTGDTTLDRAIVTFSRKLGDAMSRGGDGTTADGVLREALELAGPANPERQRMLMVLSRVAVQRSRPRDATRFLGQALELASQQGDSRGEARAHGALGKLRLEDGDALTAANTLETAAKLAAAVKDDRLLIDVLIARSKALVAVGDEAGATTALAVAREAADRVGLKVLVAATIAAGAELSEPAEAAEKYREAGRLAAEAGDAAGSKRWFRLGRVSEARQAG